MNNKILILVSNTTHMYKAIEISKGLAPFNYSIDLIYDSSYPKYAQNLSDLIQSYKNNFNSITEFKLPVSILNKVHYLKYWKNKLSNKPYKVSFYFTEGGTAESFFIEQMNKKSIKTIVLQWANTAHPSFYKKKKLNFRTIFRDIFLKINGIYFFRPNYLGQGKSSEMWLFSKYWMDFFSSLYPEKKNKFKIFGTLFFNREPISDEVSQVTFVSGAGTNMYNDDIDGHLADIRQLYELSELLPLPFVHRIHPRDIAVDKIKKLKKEYSKVKIDSNKNIKDTLSVTKFLITIRSSVSMEAALKNIPVIIYNNGRLEITFNIAKLGYGIECTSIEQIVNYINDFKYNDINSNNYEYLLGPNANFKKMHKWIQS